MENITSFIEGKLKLKVNINKIAVERYWKCILYLTCGSFQC